jgi:uncharacterized membrane protein
MYLKNKKAQVSDTITWIVATMIIVVVLSISVFFTISLSGQKKIFLEDREKDLLATKSITGFLKNAEKTLGSPALLSDRVSGTNNDIEKLLEVLPIKEALVIGAHSSGPATTTIFKIGVMGWSFEKGSKKDISLGSMHIHGGVQLNFWANCYNSGCG